MATFVNRPHELVGYLETARSEIALIHECERLLEMQFSYVAKLQFIRFSTVIDAVNCNQHETNVKTRIAMHRYKNEIQNCRSRVNTYRSTLRLRGKNMQVLLKWMNRYDPELYSFKTRLHRAEDMLQQVARIEARAARFDELCKNQLVLIDSIISAFSRSTLRNEPFDEKARFAMIVKNEDQFNLLAFPV